MTREEMLRALQADVNEWPQRVKEAGVTNAAGAAYARAERVRRMREEMRSGKRKRPSLPELDQGL
jgi:hypothetical protein